MVLQGDQVRQVRLVAYLGPEGALPRYSLRPTMLRVGDTRSGTDRRVRGCLGTYYLASVDEHGRRKYARTPGIFLACACSLVGAYRLALTCLCTGESASGTASVLYGTDCAVWRCIWSRCSAVLSRCSAVLSRCSMVLTGCSMVLSGCGVVRPVSPFRTTINYGSAAMHARMARYALPPAYALATLRSRIQEHSTLLCVVFFVCTFWNVTSWRRRWLTWGVLPGGVLPGRRRSRCTPSLRSLAVLARRHRLPCWCSGAQCGLGSGC